MIGTTTVDPSIIASPKTESATCLVCKTIIQPLIVPCHNRVLTLLKINAQRHPNEQLCFANRITEDVGFQLNDNVCAENHHKTIYCSPR